MTLTVRRGSVNRRPYNVAGTTLAEIQAQIDRNGPRDPNDGRRYSGVCAGTFVIGIGGRDYVFEPVGGATGHRLRCRIGSGSVTVECTIRLPNATGRLSSTSQREWDRFVAAVGTHEDGHVDAYMAEARVIATEIEALSGEGEGRDERSAQRAAQAALAQSFNRSFSQRGLEERANEVARRYDARNDHGRSQGAVLNTRIT